MVSGIGIHTLMCKGGWWCRVWVSKGGGKPNKGLGPHPTWESPIHAIR